ncbi:MAG: ferrochelatase [Deltaproteobacteria bacterium]|nr:ferrochelatase [Deltaproteobacteria bacterium]
MRGREPNCEAVMLIGFGGPTAAAEVRPFLDRVLADRPIPRERYEEVVRHYDAVGGRSPYNEMTMRLAAALQHKLQHMGIRAPVIIAFRNMPPFFDDALRDLKQRGIHRALGFVLAAHRSEASWDRYLDEIKLAREQLGGEVSAVEYPSSWHDDPEFVEAVAERTRAALEHLDASAELIFTAHSIPLLMGGRAGYVEQLNESARLIAQYLKRNSWTLAFQSRSGSPRDRWLEPDVKDVLRRFSGGQVVLVPLGFLCDHVEVLYDLDIEAAKAAREAGVTMVRAATVGEHPKFVEMIAKIAGQYISPISS